MSRNGHAPPRVEVFPDVASASRAAARSFETLAVDAEAAGRTFSVALTGGSSPVALYQALASDEWRERIPWPSIHFFWGDDRCVPPAHPRSNFGLANRLLLSRVSIPPENIHRIKGETPPARAALDYAAELEAFFGATIPIFDLVHLGMGTDGHVCSLLPFDDILKERHATTAVALLRPLGEWRVTLTYPVLNAARRVEFLVFGKSKSNRVREVLAGARDPIRIPAQGVRPTSGETVWWLDEAAAGG